MLFPKHLNNFQCFLETRRTSFRLPGYSTSSIVQNRYTWRWTSPLFLIHQWCQSPWMHTHVQHTVSRALQNWPTDNNDVQEPNGFNFYTEDSSSRAHLTISTYGLNWPLSFHLWSTVFKLDAKTTSNLTQSESCFILWTCQLEKLHETWAYPHHD